MGRTLQISGGIITTLALCVALWFLFQPHIPITANQPASQPEPGYEAGGGACRPEALAAIPNAVARQSAADDCARQREAHRAQQADLVQQTRAANGNEVVAALTWDEARLALLTALVSLVATALLVWTLWETRSTNRAQLRAYVGINEMVCQPKGPVVGKRHLGVQFKNFGATPAHNVRIDAALANKDGRPVAVGKPTRFMTLPPTQVVTASFPVPEDTVRNGLSGETVYWVVSWDYDDVFERRHHESMHISSEPGQLLLGLVGGVAVADA